MPTPYGSRGGMVFGVEELRVLRRALALALKPEPASTEDLQECLRLAESVDEAASEGERLRAFLVADLGRYRAALPGSVTGYLALLEEAVSGGGYRPVADDLAALRALRGNPVAAGLLEQCQVLPVSPVSPVPPVHHAHHVIPVVPGCRAPLFAEGAGKEPAKPSRPPRPAKPSEPSQPPEKPGVPAPKPSRPIPTPGEVFPRRKPASPPPPPPQRPEQLAVG